jgi:hypothetical protein
MRLPDKLSRRTFLLGSCLTFSACSKRNTARVELEREVVLRQELWSSLQPFQVRIGATFSTPQPAKDVLALIPELKSLIKVAVRLHPRISEEPKPEESKIGGQFLWPKDERWPADDAKQVMIPVLQLRSDDAGPIRFPDGKNLMQLFWSGRPGSDAVKIVWRSRSAVGDELAPSPILAQAHPRLEPFPCRLFPERIAEFPDYLSLPEETRKQVGERVGQVDYHLLLSVARGWKVGGYPIIAAAADPITCPTCRWGMDFLLNAPTQEWGVRTASRWKPTESRDEHKSMTYQESNQLRSVYVCRRCPDWPTRMIIAAFD